MADDEEALEALRHEDRIYRSVIEYLGRFGVPEPADGIVQFADQRTGLIRALPVDAQETLVLLMRAHNEYVQRQQDLANMRLEINEPRREATLFYGRVLANVQRFVAQYSEVSRNAYTPEDIRTIRYRMASLREQVEYLHRMYERTNVYHEDAQHDVEFYYLPSRVNERRLQFNMFGDVLDSLERRLRLVDPPSGFEMPSSRYKPY